ncbi:MAG: low temperature requirement protein LtrA [Verrucomicrobiales bacterium]|jgi:low temperature requirement protein LtrA
MEQEEHGADLSPEELATSIDELDEKSAHPLELFFDLVFVFAITQVVSLIAHDLHLSGILQGTLLLGLLWWGWGTWTWTLNAVDLEPRLYRIAVMIAMVGVFFMAFSVPTAFGSDAMWLAVGYLVMRFISMAVMVHGTRDQPVEQKAILVYLPVALFAPVLVIIGAAVGGEALQWVWLGALAVEVGSALIAVGIALGRDVDSAPVPATALLAGLFVACAMWWAYFDRLQGVWESALRLADEHHAGRLGQTCTRCSTTQ